MLGGLDYKSFIALVRRGLQTVGISFAAGTAAAPTVKVGDEQNGLFSPGADLLAIAAGGVEVQRFGATLGGEYRSTQVFTASGTWTKPAGLKRVRVTVVGAGGGSGACQTTTGSDFAASLGGAGGGTAIKTIAAASLGATETVTVGAAGTAGVADLGAGGAGGATSFGAHCSATGGGGGTAGAAAGTSNPGGSITAGIGSGGDFNLQGGAPTPATWGVTPSMLLGSAGGSSSLGGSAPYVGNNTSGVAGRAYGGGASGAASTASQAGRNGSAGSAGIVIVEEFF